jgi:hypothetical protein
MIPTAGTGGRIQQMTSNVAADRKAKIQMSPMNQANQAPPQAVAPVPAIDPSSPVPQQNPGVKLSSIDGQTKEAFIQALAALPLLPMAGRGLLTAGRWLAPKLLGASRGAKAVEGVGRGLRQARLAMHNMPGGRHLTRFGRSAMEYANNPWTQAAAFAPFAYQMATGGGGGQPGQMTHSPGMGPAEALQSASISGGVGRPVRPGDFPQATNMQGYPGMGGMVHSASAEDINPGKRLVKLARAREDYFN